MIQTSFTRMFGLAHPVMLAPMGAVSGACTDLGPGIRSKRVTTWTFIWLMFLLKIPIVGLFLIVRWAVRQTPETAPGQDGGGSQPLHPVHPHRPRSRLPRPPRRGPHGESPPASPTRVRSAVARQRATRG